MGREKKEFMVGRERGIVYEMGKKCGEKKFIGGGGEERRWGWKEWKLMGVNRVEKL